MLGLATAAVVMLGGAGFFVWQTFVTEPEPAPVKSKPSPGATAPAVGSAPASPPAPAATASPPTPSATLNAAARAPAQAIHKAQAVANTQGGKARDTDDIVASDQPVPARTIKPAAQTSAAATELAPGVSATSNTEGIAGTADSAFRTYIANLRVAGVAAGSNPKALINGRLVRPGETIDATLGITFEGLDGKNLIFKDRSGATVLRRY